MVGCLYFYFSCISGFFVVGIYSFIRIRLLNLDFFVLWLSLLCLIFWFFGPHFCPSFFFCLCLLFFKIFKALPIRSGAVLICRGNFMCSTWLCGSFVLKGSFSSYEVLSVLCWFRVQIFGERNIVM